PAKKFQHNAISIEALVILANYDDLLRDGVNQLRKVPFDLLPILDISSCGVPTDDLPLLVPKRVVTIQEPAILSIFSTYSRFDFPAYAARKCVLSGRAYSIQIVRMTDPSPKVACLDLF